MHPNAHIDQISIEYNAFFPVLSGAIAAATVTPPGRHFYAFFRLSLLSQIAHEENVMPTSHAYVQCALLYTSSGGERRIRVHTLAVPVVSDLGEMYKAADGAASASLLARLAVEKTLTARLEDARQAVAARVLAVLKEYKVCEAREGFGRDFWMSFALLSGGINIASTLAGAEQFLVWGRTDCILHIWTKCCVTYVNGDWTNWCHTERGLQSMQHGRNQTLELSP